MMILGHKIRIYPDNEQTSALTKAVGVARFTYNWALNEWKLWYEYDQKPNFLKLKKYFNKIKKNKYPWIYDSLRDANSQEFVHLQRAFKNFFEGRSKYPVFKKKGKNDSFYISNDKFRIKDQKVKLPKIGWIDMAEKLRFDGKIQSATVSRISNYWFISFNVDVPDYKKDRTLNNEIGIDLGLKNFITCSDGFISKPNNELRKDLKKLRRVSRRHSRKKKGSNNRKKSQVRLSKLHYRISNKRKDVIHKLTSKICRENQSIIIEDLNVSGMIRNRKLSRSIQDASFGEFRRQLEYKSKIYFCNLIKAPRFFPSSKQCSNCGCLKEDLKLSDRIYSCNHCGFIIDRDLNASINLKYLINSSTLGFRGINASGHTGSGHRSKSGDETGVVEGRTNILITCDH